LPFGTVPAKTLDVHGDCNISGNFTVGGTKSSYVDTKSYGKRLLYAVEAPDNRFTDEGISETQDGNATVNLDPIFVESVEGDFVVHITPYGKANLYVSEVGRDYFRVQALNGEPNVKFAWRLSSFRKGYKGVRFAAAA
jgi:hypothetical protein